MKIESIRALLIDREFDELTPEAAELLDDWLATDPELASEVKKVRETLSAAAKTTNLFPELGRPELIVTPLRQSRRALLPFALAASIILLIGISGWAGFSAGQHNFQARLTKPKPLKPIQPATPSSPWAQYKLASSPEGGLMAVRNDLKN
jgi:hypothetical protein